MEYEDGMTLKDKGRKDFIHTHNRTRKNWLGLLKSVKGRKGQKFRSEEDFWPSRDHQSTLDYHPRTPACMRTGTGTYVNNSLDT